MADRNKTKLDREKREPMTFPERVCVRLDNDVQALLNASGEEVTWASQGHAINAALRKALMHRFNRPAMRIRIDPFEQLVWHKKLRRKP